MVEKQPLPCAATCPLKSFGIPMCHLGMLIAKEIDIFDCTKTINNLQTEYSHKSGITKVKFVINSETVTILVTTATPDYLRQNPKTAWIKAAQIGDGYITPLI